MAITFPTDISDLTCLYHAKDTSSITVNGSNVITQWNDLSGNNNHLTDVLGSPLSGTRTHNGHNVVDLDGSSALRLPSVITLTAPWTIVTTAELDVIGSFRHLMGVQTNGTWTGLGVNLNNPPVMNFFHNELNNGNGPHTTAAGEFFRLIAVSNNTDSHYYKNGVDGGTFTSGNADYNAVTIGGMSGTGSRWDGKGCTFAIYDKALTSTEATDLDDWMAAEWASSSSVRPVKLHNIDNQFSSVVSSRLGGVLE